MTIGLLTGRSTRNAVRSPPSKLSMVMRQNGQADSIRFSVLRQLQQSHLVTETWAYGRCLGCLEASEGPSIFWSEFDWL